MAKASEDTITTIFQEILNENGINADAFPIWKTPIGIRKPDILIKNHKIYPLEAKIKEKDLIKDIAKVQNDYFKHVNTLNIGGAFVLKHPKPEKLELHLDRKSMKKKLLSTKFRLITMFPQDDLRQFEIIDDNLMNLIPIIKDIVYYKRINQEVNPKNAIEVLQGSTKHLETVIRTVKMEILVEKMGGFELFEDILDIDVKKDYSSFRVAASFFLLTQLLFYHVVAAYKDNLKPLEEIRSTSDLNRKYFDKVLQYNYKVIFGIDISSHLPNTTVKKINEIILILKSLKPENIRGDLIGTVFHDLIPLKVRKRVAAYYTNILATELLAELTIENPNMSVLDLACGSGGLLVAAYHRKKRLIEKSREFMQKDHADFINDHIFGIDIMPFSVNVASCNLALQSPEYITNFVNIALWDSIDLKPGDIIPEFVNLKYLFRTSTLERWIGTPEDKKIRRIAQLNDSEKEEIQLSKFDTILMNPPFTRQERLPTVYKEKIKIRFDDKFKNIYNDRMSLHGVFILLADEFLKQNGKIGLVLPASFLARKSFKELREYICTNYHIEIVLYNTSRYNFSESTLWREILLIVKKSKETNRTTKICRLVNFPNTIEDVLNLVNNIRSGKNITKDYEIIEYKQNELLEINKISDWSSITIFSDLLHEIYDVFKEDDRFIPLSSKYDCIRCDLNHFKAKNELSCIIQKETKKNTKQLKEKWIATKSEESSVKIEHIAIGGAEFNLHLSKMKRGLRTTSNLRTINTDNELDYILISSFKGYKSAFLRYMLSKEKAERFKDWDFDKIKENFEKRKSYFIMNRRLFLTSQGTSFVAFSSNIPFVSPRYMVFLQYEERCKQTNISLD